MQSIEKSIKLHLSTGNNEGIVKTLSEALKNNRIEEHELAWALGAVFEGNIKEAFDFIPVFIENYPHSFHPIRVFHADLLARKQNFDSATNEARIFLRRITDSNLINNLSDKPILQDGVARAWLLLTSAYTELGARSYSKRALLYGLKFLSEPYWIESIRSEIHQLERELQEDSLNKLNEKWELFFSNSGDWESLYAYCQEKMFLNMKKRVELIQNNFAYNPSFEMNKETLLLIVQKNGAFALA